MTLRTVAPVFYHQRRELRFCPDWVTGSTLQGSREVGVRNTGDRESLSRSTDWVLQVRTSAWGHPRRQEICTKGHMLSEEEGVSGIINQTRHFIPMAVPVNWDPPTRELAVLIGEESHGSCLGSMFITDRKQFTDRVITALPA